MSAARTSSELFEERRAAWPRSLGMLEAGSDLGPYHVEALISLNRTTAIYQCVDLAGGGRAAVKLLLPDARRDALECARFYREQAIGMTLNHPGIVKVHGPNPDDSQPYTVLEWVYGSSLRDVLEKGSVRRVQESAKIVRQICNALQHAHSHGVVHRDLKP